MKIAIIGTGFIGGTLGRALANAGQEVTFGSRHADDQVSSGTTARVASVGDALAGSDVIVLALPGAAAPTSLPSTAMRWPAKSSSMPPTAWEKR